MAAMQETAPRKLTRVFDHRVAGAYIAPNDVLEPSRETDVEVSYFGDRDHFRMWMHRDSN
jgi:hypothetical protein